MTTFRNIYDIFMYPRCNKGLRKLLDHFRNQIYLEKKEK